MYPSLGTIKRIKRALIAGIGFEMNYREYYINIQ